jgi:hypothetical protein
MCFYIFLLEALTGARVAVTAEVFVVAGAGDARRGRRDGGSAGHWRVGGGTQH